MPSDDHLVGLALIRLAEYGEKAGTTQESRFRTRLHARLQKEGWTPVRYDPRRQKLQDRLGRSPVNLFTENTRSTYIPLKPVVKGTPLLPYLSVVADRTLSVFRLLLLVFMEDTEDDSLRSVGFRFESPEGEGGRHNYWHVQLTSSFEQNGGQVHPSTPSWLPSNTPAIPLDARSAASCVVALMVALYGGVEADTLVRNLPNVSDESVRRLRREVRALGGNRGDQE